MRVSSVPCRFDRNPNHRKGKTGNEAQDAKDAGPAETRYDEDLDREQGEPNQSQNELLHTSESCEPMPSEKQYEACDSHDTRSTKSWGIEFVLRARDELCE